MRKKVAAMIFSLCMAVGVMGGCGADEPGSAEGSAEGTPEAEGSAVGASEAETAENSDGPVQEETEPEYYLAKYTHYQHWNNEYGEGTWSETKEYDADGNVTREGNSSEDEFGYSGSELQYNAAGNLVRLDYYGNPGGEEGAEPVMTGWCDYEYDSAGNLIQELSYSFYKETYGDDLTPVYTYYEGGFPSGVLEYDSDGNILKNISYDGAGQAIERIENTYDEKGNLITEEVYRYEIYDEAGDGPVYNEEGILDFRDEMEYDAAGNGVKTTRYDKDGEIISVTEREYDGSNHLLAEVSTYTDDGFEERTEYNYNSDGNCISEKYSYGGTTEHEYDANGNEIKNIYYDENGEGKVQFEAEYDAEGNETKRIDYEYDMDGGITTTEAVSAYDDAGNLVERKSSGGWDEFWQRYEYDAKGNNTKITELDQEGNVLSETSYEYNEEGEQTKYVTIDGASTVIQSAEYDAQGFLLSRTVDGTELSVTEEHDEAGNLTRRAFSDSTGVVEEYTFTYAEK